MTIGPNINFDGFSGPTGSGGVFFEGGGITSVTLSDPFEYDLTDGGGLYATGAWEMWFINATFNAEPKHNSCNCARPAIATPPTQTASNHGWSMQVEVSANDGVVLHDVKLNNRYMAGIRGDFPRTIYGCGEISHWSRERNHNLLWG